jgi:hypothetical protein
VWVRNLVTDPKGSTDLLGRSENRMLNRKVGPKREQAIGSWRRIMRRLITPHKALTSYCKRDETKNSNLGKGRSMHGEINACIN